CIVQPTTGIYTLSLHDALPIWQSVMTLWRLPRRPHRVFSKILLTSGEEVSTVPAGGASVCSTSPVSAVGSGVPGKPVISTYRNRSEEHTSELQSRFELVCRLLR